MLTPILAHIAGVPVEETLLSVGPAIAAAFSVGVVHIRALRDRASFDDDDDRLLDEDDLLDEEGLLDEDDLLDDDDPLPDDDYASAEHGERRAERRDRAAGHAVDRIPAA